MVATATLILISSGANGLGVDVDALAVPDMILSNSSCGLNTMIKITVHRMIRHQIQNPRCPYHHAAAVSAIDATQMILVGVLT